MKPRIVLTLVGLIAVAGIYTLSVMDRSQDLAAKAAVSGSLRYFHDAEETVSRVNGLIESREWETLASFYDLAGSGLSPHELTSGHFFTGENEAAGASQEPKPFPAGASFLRVESTGSSDVFKIFVSIDAAPGPVVTAAGPTLPPEPTIVSFPAIRHPQGYRLLPAIIQEEVPTPAWP